MKYILTHNLKWNKTEDLQIRGYETFISLEYDKFVLCSSQFGILI